jgi:hypothetical protein
MRETIVWTLIALTLFLVAWFWVKPLAFPISGAKIEMIPISKTHKWDWKAPVPSPPPAKGEEKPAPQTHGKGLKLYDAPIPPAIPDVPAPTPPTKYEEFKREVAEWGGILGKFSPVITTILLFVVKRGKKKKGELT